MDDKLKAAIDKELDKAAAEQERYEQNARRIAAAVNHADALVALLEDNRLVFEAVVAGDIDAVYEAQASVEKIDKALAALRAAKEG